MVASKQHRHGPAWHWAHHVDSMNSSTRQDHTVTKCVHVIEVTRATKDFLAVLALDGVLQNCLHNLADTGRNVDFTPSEPKVYLQPELFEPTMTKLRSDKFTMVGQPGCHTIHAAEVSLEDLMSCHVIASCRYIHFVERAINNARKSASIRVKRRAIIEVRLDADAFDDSDFDFLEDCAIETAFTIGAALTL